MCLSRESLEILAIRLTERAGPAGAKGKGSPDRIPEDLFLPGEEDMRKHLDQCRLCRKRLLEELYSLHRYMEGFNHPLNETRFRGMVGKAVVEGREGEGGGVPAVETRLYLDADAGEEDDDEPALAAASRPRGGRPIRHCSRDGSMILRQRPGSASAPARLQLLADDPRLVAGAEVVIGERSFKADGEGVLTEDEALAAAAGAAMIVVRSARI